MFFSRSDNDRGGWGGTTSDLTFPSLCTIHGEVRRLVSLQATPLHTWSKHFDLLGMAPLPNVDLEKM